MKKVLYMIVILAMVLALCACGKDAPNTTDPTQTTPPTDAPTEPSVAPTEPTIDPTEPPECNHSFTDANCTSGPICTLCGYASGSALGHVYKDSICIHCGDKLPQDVPTDCQHDYVLARQTAPTCTGEGAMEYQCSKCDHTYVQTVAATGHRFSDATCTAPKTCGICGITDGNALGHSYQDGACTRCGEADPDAPREVIYTVTVRSDKGVAIEGVSVSVYTGSSSPAATGRTNAKGVATMTLMSWDSYRIVLSDVPKEFEIKESYTFRSTNVNINLKTISVISPTDHSKANYKVGSAMGDFTLTDVQGNTYTLSDLLKEKDLVVLNFWFTTCGWCIKEFPYLDSIHQRYENVQLLALDPYDTAQQISAFQSVYGYTFPMVQDNIGLSAGFNITGYPTTVFIGKNGQIIAIEAGAILTQGEWDQCIDTMLKK